MSEQKRDDETQTAYAVRLIRAEAWAEGMRFGSSRAMRHMSDEPHLPLASEADNPYLTTRPSQDAAGDAGRET